MKFQARQNSIFNDRDANKIGNFLYKTYPGGFKAKDVLEAARPKSSPIHNYFDWDDETAAEKYRLKQARNLISSIEIVIAEVPTRAFTSPVNISIDEGKTTKAYFKMEDAIKTPYIWSQVLNRALEELETFKLKYLHLKELDSVFRALDQVKEKRHGKKESDKEKGRKKGKGRKKVRNTSASTKKVQNNPRRNKSSSSKQLQRKNSKRNRGLVSKTS